MNSATEFDDLIHRFVEGQCSETESRVLFEAIAANPELQEDFHRAVALQGMLNKIVAGYIPPTELAAQVEQHLGLVVAEDVAPLNVPTATSALPTASFSALKIALLSAGILGLGLVATWFAFPVHQAATSPSASQAVASAGSQSGVPSVQPVPSPVNQGESGTHGESSSSTLAERNADASYESRMTSPETHAAPSANATVQRNTSRRFESRDRASKEVVSHSVASSTTDHQFVQRDALHDAGAQSSKNVHAYQAASNENEVSDATKQRIHKNMRSIAATKHKKSSLHASSDRSALNRSDIQAGANELRQTANDNDKANTTALVNANGLGNTGVTESGSEQEAQIRVQAFAGSSVAAGTDNTIPISMGSSSEPWFGTSAAVAPGESSWLHSIMPDKLHATLGALAARTPISGSTSGSGLQSDVQVQDWSIGLAWSCASWLDIGIEGGSQYLPLYLINGTDLQLENSRLVFGLNAQFHVALGGSAEESSWQLIAGPMAGLSKAGTTLGLQAGLGYDLSHTTQLQLAPTYSLQFLNNGSTQLRAGRLGVECSIYYRL